MNAKIVNGTAKKNELNGTWFSFVWWLAHLSYFALNCFNEQRVTFATMGYARQECLNNKYVTERRQWLSFVFWLFDNPSHPLQLPRQNVEQCQARRRKPQVQFLHLASIFTRKPRIRKYNHAETCIAPGERQRPKAPGGITCLSVKGNTLFTIIRTASCRNVRILYFSGPKRVCQEDS